MATLTPAPQHIPSWNFADRMRKARIDAGLTAQQIADAIGISRKSVTNYESGETKPLKPILAAWSLITGVPVEWITTGQYPHRDSNSEPTDYEMEASRQRFRLRRQGRRLHRPRVAA